MLIKTFHSPANLSLYITDNFYVKTMFVFIFFFCSTISFGGDWNYALKELHDNPNIKEAFKEVSREAKDTWEASNGNVHAFLTESFDNSGCASCPSILGLTNDVNKILEQIPPSPKDSEAMKEELPIKLNKLKFLYYISKSNLPGQKSPCQIFKPVTTTEPLAADMKGRFELAYQDILPYPNIAELQLFHPDSDEVVYFYRGVGAQSNIFIEATMRKNGTATFKYFYYTPPASGSESTAASEAPDPTKDTYSFSGPEIERRGILPRNLHVMQVVTKTHLDKENDYSLNSSTDLSVTGHTLNLAVQNSKGNNDVIAAAFKASPKGDKIDYSVAIPYEIGYYDHTQVKTNLTASNSGEAINLTLTDSNETWLNTGVSRNSSTGKTSYYIEKVTTLAPTETLSTKYGSEPQTGQYFSLQHKKSMRDNVSMVLDLRYDLNAPPGASSPVTLTYQFNKKF